jgi:hypothetical protein
VIDFVAKIINFSVVNQTATASGAAVAQTVAAMVPGFRRRRFNARAPDVR